MFKTHRSEIGNFFFFFFPATIFGFLTNRMTRNFETRLQRSRTEQNAISDNCTYRYECIAQKTYTFLFFFFFLQKENRNFLLFVAFEMETFKFTAGEKHTFRYVEKETPPPPYCTTPHGGKTRTTTSKSMNKSCAFIIFVGAIITRYVITRRGTRGKRSFLNVRSVFYGLHVVHE